MRAGPDGRCCNVDLVRKDIYNVINAHIVVCRLSTSEAAAYLGRSVKTV
jgi:hypothetical protein